MSARADSDVAADGRHALHPDWYRANYMLAVAFATLAAAPEEQLTAASPPLTRVSAEQRAIEHTAVVAEAVEERLLRIGRKQRGADAQLQEFLLALEPTVLVLAAGLARHWGWIGCEHATKTSQQPRRLRDLFRRLPLIGHRASRVQPRERQENQTVLDRKALLEELRSASLDHRQLIDYVLSLALDYRARYNLACYYTGVAESEAQSLPESVERGATADDSYRRAFVQLSTALRMAPLDLATWALGDPALKPLRNHHQFGPQVSALVRELVPPRTDVTDKKREEAAPATPKHPAA